MKTLNFILLFMLPIIAFAQNSYLDDIFDKYSGKQGYTSVYITRYMFELFAEIDTDEDLKEFKDVTSRLDAIKILTTSDDAMEEHIASFKKDLIVNLPKSQYKELMIVREDKTKITFKIREANSKIIELMMIVDDDLQTVLIYLSGDIDLKKISKLSKSMNVSGFEYLNRVSE